MKQQPPNQHDTDRLLGDSLSHGDKTKLANLLGVSGSEICRQCNPEDPKQSFYYRFKRSMFWLKTQVNERAARIIVADFRADFESWDTPVVKPESLAALVVAADREGDDVIQSWAEGKPLHEQIMHATEAIAALEKFREAARKAARIREAV